MYLHLAGTRALVDSHCAEEEVEKAAPICDPQWNVIPNIRLYVIK